MNAIVCKQPGELKYIKKDIPILQKGHSLLKIKRVGICGTDFHAYEGTQPYFEYPRILGHEIAAEIIETNSGNGFHPGDKVTIVPYFNCGKCIACKNGKPNCCSSLQVFGVHIDGAMCEFISVPDFSIVPGNGLNFDELALIEPLAIGAHGIRRSEIVKGQFVLIIGAGPIGLGAMEFAKIAGGQVIGMDINNSRLQFCKEQLNIPFTINALSADVLEQVKTITSGEMPSIVIDCTGNLNAINNAFQFISHGGKFVLIGLQKGNLNINHREFHKREATLMSSRNATMQDFEHVIANIKNKKIDPFKFITHRVQFSEFVSQFLVLKNAQSDVIKALIEL